MLKKEADIIINFISENKKKLNEREIKEIESKLLEDKNVKFENNDMKFVFQGEFTKEKKEKFQEIIGIMEFENKEYRINLFQVLVKRNNKLVIYKMLKQNIEIGDKIVHIDSLEIKKENLEIKFNHNSNVLTIKEKRSTREHQLLKETVLENPKYTLKKILKAKNISWGK